MEIANGTKVPESISNLWVLEDRMIAQQMKKIEDTEEVGPFPTVQSKLKFGTVMIFGTSGEVDSNISFEDLWNEPENKLIK